MTSNDRDGTTVRRVHQETGKPTMQEEIFYPPASTGITTGASGSDRARIEDVTDADGDADGDADSEQQSRET